jgi:hypothetical protein
MTRRSWATLISIAALPSAIGVAGFGCSSTSNPATASTDGGADASTPLEDAAPPTRVSLQWATAAPGAQVCAYLFAGLDPTTAPSPASALACVTSAADGTFTLPSVPIRTNLAITVNKPGYIPVVRSVGTASTPMDETTQPIQMFPTSSETDPVPSVMVDWQNKGQIYMFALNGPGGTVAMSPMSGDGPLYSASGQYSASATAFTSAGPYATLGYFNVAPGTYTLTVAASTVDCEPVLAPVAAFFGFPTGAAHALQVLVLPGYVSGYVGVLCTAVPVIVPVDGGPIVDSGAVVDSGPTSDSGDVVDSGSVLDSGSAIDGAVDGSAVDGSAVDGGVADGSAVDGG